jgi:hypothetical protein
MGGQYRQGDVLVVAVDSIPVNAVAVSRTGGNVVLAYGEVTGHRHAIADRHAELIAGPDEQVEQLFLRITGFAAILEHPEHKSITLPVGSYRVIRQREYTPAARRYAPAATRYVFD